MAIPLRQPSHGPSGYGGPPVWRTGYWSGAIWIIVVTSAVSFVDLFSRGAISGAGALTITDLKRGFVWQLLTYQLLHAGPLHLIFNMMWLYLIGPIVEPMLGKRRFLILYGFSGVVGGVAFLVWQMLVRDGSAAVLVGASGSILGVMAAATCVAPRYSIRLWFPPITIQLWVIFVVAVALALLSVRLGYDNAGGDAAHLGGAAAGLVGFAFRGKIGRFGARSKSKFWKPGDPARRFFRE